MTAIRLSLCIPTHNFGRFIGETLQSIVTQDGADEIEILVLDSASTDNTAEAVAAFQARHPQIRYVREAEKGGIDRDMAKSVDYASGDYCWLFSSDDIMRKGALRQVLNQLKEGNDLILCKHIECTFDMTPITEWPVLNVSEATVFDLGEASARRNYFARAANTEAFFSFMCGLIVRKSVWNGVPLNEAFVGSCWAHVARLLEIMLTRGLRVKYVAQPYLDRRGGNDSFSARGAVYRNGIGIDGYHRLGDVFFGHDSPEAFHIRRAIRNEYGIRTFLHCKRLCRDNPERESKRDLDRQVRKTFCDFSWSGICKQALYHAYPVWLYVLTRHAYKTARAIVGRR